MGRIVRIAWRTLNTARVVTSSTTRVVDAFSKVSAIVPTQSKVRSILGGTQEKHRVARFGRTNVGILKKKMQPQLKVDPIRVGKLSLFGLLMTWSPVFGTTEVTVYPNLLASMDMVVFSRLANLAAFAVAMLVLSASGDQARPYYRKRALATVSAIVGTLGMIVGGAVGFGWLPLGWLPVGGALRGVCWGIMVVFWINTLMHIDGREAGASVVAALFVYAAVGFAIALYATAFPFLSFLLLALCPGVGCAACISLRQSVQGDAPVDQESVEAPAPTRWVLYLANFVFGAMISSLLYYFAVYDQPLYVFAFCAMAFTVLLVYCFFWGDIDVHLAFRMFMMCFAIVVVCLALANWHDGAVSLCVVSAVLVIILLYMIIIFADTQARFRAAFWRIPGMCQVFAAFGMMFAVALLHWTGLEQVIRPSHLLLLSAGCIMFVSALFAPTGQTKTRPWGFASLIPEETQELRQVRRCGELATQFKLTPRELEILLRVVAGATKDEVAEALVISPATAKTHIRNIYGKIGVHSKNELLELLEK